MCFVPRWYAETQCSTGFLLCSVHIQSGTHYEAGCLSGRSLAAPMKFTGIHCLFHIFQDDFTFTNCLPTGLHLDSAIGLVFCLLLTLLISSKVWTGTFIQLLTPLLMQLLQLHKWEWRRQEKPQWCMDTWRHHFFPISNWQGPVILQGFFFSSLPPP